MSKDVLRLTFSDICRGYSLSKYKGSPLYIKHLTHHDQVDVEDYYNEMMVFAKKRGLKSEAEKLEWLEKTGLWTKKDESEVSNQKLYVDNLEKSKKNFPIKSQLEKHKELIKTEQFKFYQLNQKKAKLLDLTCELFANNRQNDYYVFLSIYKDKNLEERFLSREEFEELTDSELQELTDIYLSVSSRFNIRNIKIISISDFFLSYFYLCGDDITSFFKKPICEFTFNQLNLLSYAGYFKRILESVSAVSADIKDDPDKLEEYYLMSQKAKEAIEKSGKEGGMSSFVGGTKDDYKALGLQTIDMHKIIQEKGSGMSIQDLMKITGA